MVATRNHPSDFEEPPAPTPPPKESPRKRTTRATSAATDASPTKTTTSPPATPTRTTRSAAPARSSGSAWSHTPSNLTLIWLAISVPLVIWDTAYVLLRPHSMPGGALHKPLWIPYALYGEVDHVYGFKAYNAHAGWTAAQGTLNTLETLAYCAYLYAVYAYGVPEEEQGTGAPDVGVMGRLRGLSERRTVEGRVAAGAVVLAYTVANVTFWKTILYWLNEAFSGFDNIGHNSLVNLVFLWIIPNGLWLLFPAYMMYVYGAEILQGLEAAAEGGKKSR